MTGDRTSWTVELTRQAERDLRRLSGQALEQAFRALSRLEADPLHGEPLSGSLSGVRSLHFRVAGSGHYRAAYCCLTDECVCLVFAIGTRENFYRDAERRWNALRIE